MKKRAISAQKLRTSESGVVVNQKLSGARTASKNLLHASSPMRPLLGWNMFRRGIGSVRKSNSKSVPRFIIEDVNKAIGMNTTN